MTKAAVRAMDAVTAFLANLPGGGMKVKNFIVAGASKRGWATWSVAAVDPRVAAIAPIVIDTLNVPQVFEHTYQAYGFWPPAVQDYVDMGMMNRSGTPQMDASGDRRPVPIPRAPRAAALLLARRPRRRRADCARRRYAVASDALAGHQSEGPRLPPRDHR